MRHRQQQNPCNKNQFLSERIDWRIQNLHSEYLHAPAALPEASHANSHHSLESLNLQPEAAKGFSCTVWLQKGKPGKPTLDPQKQHFLHNGSHKQNLCERIAIQNPGILEPCARHYIKYMTRVSDPVSRIQCLICLDSR